MSWLKKGPVLGLLGGLALVWILTALLLDPLLKRTLIRHGEKAAKAKVEIDSLDTSLRRGTLELKGVAVADKDEPMRNAVELSRAAFKLDMSAALRGKFVVREAAIEGIRAGTPRRTSGALRGPAAEDGRAAKAVKEKLAPVAASVAPAKLQANAAAAVDETKLTGLKKLDEAKAKAKEVEDRWKAKEAELKGLDDEAKAIAEQVKGIGRGGSSPADILRKTSEAQAAQKRLKELIAKVDSAREQAKADVAAAQGLVREADELRRKDAAAILAAAGVPSADSQELAKRLLGAQTAAKLSNALRWMTWAREKAAARKAAAPPKAERRRGVDVEFPRARAYPQVLVEGAKLSGSVDGAVQGKALALTGLLNGVTSNPKLYGKPATLSLGGSAAGMSLNLLGRLDQQAEPVAVSLKLDGAGFPLAGAALGGGDVGGTISGGFARVAGELRSAGDAWTGEFRVFAEGVRIDPKVSLPSPANALVSDALKGLSRFSVRVGVSGREDDLKLAFSSDIGDVVAGAMKQAFSRQLEEQRKAVEAKVNALYKDKQDEARARADELARKVMAPLDERRDALERQLKEAAARAVGKPDLRKLFR